MSQEALGHVPTELPPSPIQASVPGVQPSKCIILTNQYSVLFWVLFVCLLHGCMKLDSQSSTDPQSMSYCHSCCQAKEEFSVQRSQCLLSTLCLEPQVGQYDDS